MSKYLYFILSSSPPSVLFSIVKGGVVDSFKTSNELAKISMSPVLISGFLDSLSITFPSI